MRIAPESAAFTPAIFDRPESVLCTAAGDLLASHRAASVIRVGAGGQSELIGPQPSQLAASGYLPNGIALDAAGTIFVANMDGAGGVWRIDADGQLRPHLMEVDGVALTATNFVRFDSKGRMWITSSTRCIDRSDPFNSNIRDGYVVLSDKRGTRIVADGLAFANECRLDGLERALFVCETAAARVSRYSVRGDDLGPRETWTEFDSGTYPDGCAFDSSGSLWVVSPIGNRLLRVSPDGKNELVLEDALPGQVEVARKARVDRNFGREQFYSQKGRYLHSITSIAFDREGFYLGSLADNRLAYFRLTMEQHLRAD